MAGSGCFVGVACVALAFGTDCGSNNGLGMSACSLEGRLVKRVATCNSLKTLPQGPLRVHESPFSFSGGCWALQVRKGRRVVGKKEKRRRGGGWWEKRRRGEKKGCGE